MLDIDSGCVTLCVTFLLTLYEHFVIFVSWFLVVISYVCAPTLNKVIMIIIKSPLLKLAEKTFSDSHWSFLL